MNILQVIHSVNPEHGGTVEAQRLRSAGLITQGHFVEIVCVDDPNATWLKTNPFIVHALGPSNSQYGYTDRLIPWLQQNVKRFDCVLVDGLWQYASYASWKVLHKRTTPYYVFTHGMLDPWFKKTYPLKHLKKTLYWLAAEYYVLRDAAGVIFTCEEERLLARQSFVPYKCIEKVVSLGTTTPVHDTEAVRKTFLTSHPDLANKRFLLFLSRIHPKKGCDLLISAFAAVAKKYPDLHLVIAGPDNVGLRSQLEIQSRQLEVNDRISWTGMLTGDMKWGAFRSAEAFVLPSHQENFGIVVAESLACGCPVLISNKVNIWREIQQNNCGLVCIDDRDGTREMLEKWLSYSEVEKREVAASARSTFEGKFEIMRATRELVAAIAK